MAEGCQKCDKRCETCNRCQSTCTSCQGENVCRTCNKCQVGQNHYPCTTAQRICDINTNNLRRLTNRFSFSPSPYSTDSRIRIGKKTGNATTDQYIFDRSSWNKICEWINGRTAYGDARHDDPFASCNEEIFSHTEFNRVANELGAGLTVNKDDLIYGSYFKTLENAAANFTISTDCCYYCNNDCNTTCNDCVRCNNPVCQVTCNSCQGCNSGQCPDTPQYCT